VNGPNLPWDVFATPIKARKLARLGVEQDRVVLRPAFYRQLGEAYGALAHATCALADHDAPAADCSCGFYAVADDAQLWRLGADEPELAVLDVELAGRVIEHDHGYRASYQRVTHVRFHGVCVRCGKHADTFAHRRFGGLVPSCRRCARRVVEREDVSASLAVPVSFSTDDPAPASLATRLRFVLAQMAAPVLILLVTAIVALATGSGVPLACGQLAIVVWLVTVPSLLPRLGERLGIGGTEAVRLQHRWSPVVAAVAIGCDILLTVVVIALRDVIVY
jgi:hypothetical protein